MDYRIEEDSMGDVKVPNDKYWGAQTQRSLENFAIGNKTVPFEVILAYAYIKKACANVNWQSGHLEKEKMIQMELTKSRTQAKGLEKICEEFKRQLEKANRS